MKPNNSKIIIANIGYYLLMLYHRCCTNYTVYVSSFNNTYEVAIIIVILRISKLTLREMNWPLLLKVMQLVSDGTRLSVCWTQGSVLNYSTQRDCGVCLPAFLFLLLLFSASDLSRSLAISEYCRWPESILQRSFPSWGSEYCHSFLHLPGSKGATFQFGFFWWYGWEAVAIGSDHQFLTRSFFDWCGRRAKFRVLIPITSR